MTTEFLSVPPSWTVEETLRLIQRVGGAKETVYEVYVVDPADQPTQRTWSRFANWS